MKKIILLFIVSLLLALIPLKAEAAKPIYTVNPTSKTYQGKMMNYSTYNQHTKQYYLLRSYLEQLEKTGGGTLVLNKGTYTISSTLYVPSNVTIRLKNGVILNKGTVTGTKQFGPAKSMFQLIRPSRAEKKGVVGGYNGEKNIAFIGEGTAKINMKYVKDGIAIIAGHNQNLTIDNIEFSNMYSGHFIELDASKNVVIQNSEFLNSYASKEKIKEAINLDTPDRLTEGWSQAWSTFDKTPNDKVTIKNNRFVNLDVAIGTHNYSQGKYHNAVVIQNNVIDNMRTNGIRVMNWTNAVIEKNVIKNISSTNKQGILAHGAHNPTFRHNQFENLPRAIQFAVWKNNGKAAGYAITYNKLSAANKNALETNSLKNGVEGHIRSNSIYNDYANKTEVFPLKVISLSTKPNVVYASKPEAKAYKTASKKGGYYKIFKAAERIDVYAQGNNWYYGFIKDAKGQSVRAYFHEDEVQTTKPFMPTLVYVKEGGVKAYQDKNTKSKVLTSFVFGKAINLEKLDKNWYFGYVQYKGVSTKVYFPAGQIQTTKPFVPKVVYASKGGAKAYEAMNKASKVLASYPIAHILYAEHISGDWYYGFVEQKGKQVNVYFHEDEVQTTKPFTPTLVYVKEGGIKAYHDKNTTSNVLTTFVYGKKINLEKLDKNWYFGYVDYKGVSTKAYFPVGQIQTTQPFIPLTRYASKGGATAYQTMDKTSNAIATYPHGDIVHIEYISNSWYYGFVDADGFSTKVYFHEDEVQKDKPFIPREMIVKEGRAKAYMDMNKASDVYMEFTKGRKINAEYIGDGWFYGYITHNGVSIKAYFHEDEVE